VVRQAVSHHKPLREPLHVVRKAGPHHKALHVVRQAAGTLEAVRRCGSLRTCWHLQLCGWMARGGPCSGP